MNFLFLQLLGIAVALFVVFVLIGRSAVLVVQNTDRIGRRYHIPEFLLGFVILGMATTTPEIFIGIHSSILGKGQISVGNLLGGMTLLTSFVVGVVAVVNRGIALKGLVSRPILLGVTFIFLAPAFLLYDGKLKTTDGGILLLFYFIGIFLLAYESYRERNESLTRKLWSVLVRLKGVHEEEEVLLPQEIPTGEQPLRRSLTMLVAGLASIIVLSRLALELGLYAARLLEISAFVIGFLLFAIGTNLPELTIAFTAKRFGRQALSLGNVVGSAVTNIFVLGFVGFIRPVTFVAIDSLRIALLFLVCAAVLFFFFASTGAKISRREGVALILLNITFLVLQIIFAP